MKRLFVFAVFFGGLSTTLASIFVPGFIAWYFEPPVEIGVNCRPAVEWGLEKFQLAQFASLVVGVLLGVAFGILWGRRKSGALPPQV